MKNRFVLPGILLVLALAPVAWSDLSTVDVSPGADDQQEINNMTPGSSKTFLGTRLRGPLAIGSTTYAAGDNGNPTTGLAGCADDYATPTTTAFLKTTGGTTGEAYCLGDAGKPGYRLTVVLVTDGNKNFTITPATKTGFSNIQLDDAKDSCTLKWLNTTDGYIIDGNSGCTVN